MDPPESKMSESFGAVLKVDKCADGGLFWTRQEGAPAVNLIRQRIENVLCGETALAPHLLTNSQIPSCVGIFLHSTPMAN